MARLVRDLVGREWQDVCRTLNRARRDAAPSEEEIDAVRRLLRASDEVLAGLDDDDRAALEAAITTIRTQRAQLAVDFPAELAGVVRSPTTVSA